MVRVKPFRLLAVLNVCWFTYILFLSRSYIDNVDSGNVLQKRSATGNRVRWSYRRLHHFNCTKLFTGPTALELEAAQNFTRPVKPDAFYAKLMSSCSRSMEELGYNELRRIVKDDESFPIAFNIQVYRDAGQVLRLLKALYRPHHFYCIHVDLKSPAGLYDALAATSSCIPNIFMASRRVDVRWGMYSSLEAGLICMEDLLKYEGWKYFINLTGQEYPLKTLSEIEAILKSYNNSGDVMTLNRRPVGRTKYHFKEFKRQGLKDPPPKGIRLSKGIVHVIVPRGFVDYVIHNKTALAFREWVKDTWFPDETFFSSISNSPRLGVPGSFTGDPDRKPYLGRYVNWRGVCGGKRVRHVCVFGVSDLPKLWKRRELFTNKFHANFQPVAYDCLEEWLYNKTIAQRPPEQTVNLEFYKRLPFTKNHV